MKTGAEYLTSRSKRALDTLGSLGLAAGLSPLAFAGLVSTCIDGGFQSPFYRQLRIDGEGNEFSITKLRTLARGSDKTPVAYGTYDPRATAPALVLRRFGIDEIPQLRNVVNGEMSLLGIRAVSENSLDYLQMTVPHLFDAWFEEAYKVGRPALMSASQIYKRSEREWTPSVMEQGMRIDLDYASNASLGSDIRFLGSLPINLLAANLRASYPPESVQVTDSTDEVSQVA